MQTLVTGGAGFIGSAISRSLLERGDEVRILDNFFSGFEKNVPPEAELVRADVRDLDAVRKACQGVEVVFHQAAVRSVPRSVDEPLLVDSTNVGGSLNVLVAAGEAGARRVVFASSSSVYGGGSEGPNHEEDPPNPASPYAVSKLAAEYYCKVWTHLKGLSTVSLRYFNVFGPGQHPESLYAAVFPAFISALTSGQAPEVHWDGEQSRDFTYVDDVVRANLLAASAGDDAGGQVLNIGAGTTTSVNTVLRSISDVLGTWIEPTRTPMRQGDVRRTHADISRAREVIGWEPQAAWSESVAATVQALLA